MKLSGVCLMLAALAVSASPALAESPSGASDPRARLIAMTDLLADTGAFSVDMRVGYDATQPSGQKIEFLETRRLLLARPNRLRIDLTAGDGRQEALLFDGKTMTVWDSAAGVYAQVPQPGTVDDAIVYFVRDLQMRLPLAELLTTQATREVTSRLKSIEYVEQTDVLGMPAQHLAGSTDSLDFQVWIANPGKPLLLRIVLTYRAPGSPEFRVDFVNWNFQPQISEDLFAPQFPPDAKRIPFAAQLRPVAELSQSAEETR